jgi:arylsulfatase A
MVRIQRSAAVLSTLMTVLIAATTIARAADRPNIVFILADDVGREVLGCYGGTSYKTPNLDRLAAQGAKLTHCYAMPVCHPTRVTLLTGRYPRHLGSPKWGSFPKADETKTFAHAVRNAGYATAIAGKWQICTMKNDLDHPARLGFDEWSVFGWHEGPRFHEPMIYQNGKLRDDTKGKYGPDLYVEFLLDFMKRKQKQPVLAFYSMALCHDVTDDIGKVVPYGSRGRYDNFKEMAEMMDAKVGQLLQGIDDLGMRDNTLILFTTDNGTAGKSKLSAIDDSGKKFVYENVVSKQNGEDIPGGKGQLTDWGTRVPTIAAWQGVIKPGQTWDDLVDFSDILPTFIEIAGARLPGGVQLDGTSFADRLLGKGKGHRKWAYAEGKGKFFAKTRDWKLYSDGRIFHTEADPFEKSPVAAGEVPTAAEGDLKVLRAAMRRLKTRGQ